MGSIKCLAALAACVLLAGCMQNTGTTPVISAPTTPAPTSTPPVTATSPASWAPMVQALWADAKADAALWVEAHPGDAAVVSKTETDLNPEIAALSTDGSLTTVSGALADIQKQLAVLPAGVISQSRQDQLNALVAGLQAALLLAPIIKQEFAP